MQTNPYSSVNEIHHGLAPKGKVDQPPSSVNDAKNDRNSNSLHPSQCSRRFRDTTLLRVSARNLAHFIILVACLPALDPDLDISELQYSKYTNSSVSGARLDNDQRVATSERVNDTAFCLLSESEVKYDGGALRRPRRPARPMQLCQV